MDRSGSFRSLGGYDDVHQQASVDLAGDTRPDGCVLPRILSAGAAAESGWEQLRKHPHDMKFFTWKYWIPTEQSQSQKGIQVTSKGLRRPGFDALGSRFFGESLAVNHPTNGVRARSRTGITGPLCL